MLFSYARSGSESRWGLELSIGLNRGGRGHWAVYYISPQSLIITFSYSLAQQPLDFN